jgi:hypothetical protein
MMVKFEEIRTLFIVATLGCALVAASPVLGLILPEVGSQQFSELWLLGPDHMIDCLPSTIAAGEVYSVFLGVENNMGGSEYYRLYVKLGNSSEFLPDIGGGVPSALYPIYEYQFFTDDCGVWETAVSFGFFDVVVEGDVLVVGDVTIDGLSFPVDSSAAWDSEGGRYFFVLFFELWRYDVEYDMFRFDDRFVGLWLNITAP